MPSRIQPARPIRTHPALPGSGNHRSVGSKESTSVADPHSLPVELIPVTTMISQDTSRQRSHRKSGTMTAEPFSEPVCVVIADEHVSEAEARRCLGDSLPLRVVSWESQNYLAAITELHPKVIAVWANTEELVHERCQLIASLFSRLEPTVLSITMPDVLSDAPLLEVQQLGAGTTVQIARLSDLHLR